MPHIKPPQRHPENNYSSWPFKESNRLEFIPDFNPFFFVHIPKTGGSSIITQLRKILGEGNICGFAGHCPASSAVVKWGREWFDKQFTFAVVRNPYDRFFSLYNFCMQTHKDPNYPEEEWPFGKWVEAMLVDKIREIIRGYNHIRPMVEWTHMGGYQIVDYIGRMEDLQGSWDEISRRIGISSTPLPKVNATNHEPYQDAYRKNPKAKAIVEEFFKKDFEIFGYSFEP